MESVYLAGLLSWALTRLTCLLSGRACSPLPNERLTCLNWLAAVYWPTWQTERQLDGWTDVDLKIQKTFKVWELSVRANKSQAAAAELGHTVLIFDAKGQMVNSGKICRLPTLWLSSAIEQCQSTVDSGNSITDTEILLKSMHKQPSNCGGNERHFQFNPIQVRGWNLPVRVRLCVCVCVWVGKCVHWGRGEADPGVGVGHVYSSHVLNNMPQL